MPSLPLQPTAFALLCRRSTALGFALLLAACASPAPQREAEVNKEIQRLSRAAQGKTAKLVVRYYCYDIHNEQVPNGTACQDATQKLVFEKSIQQWVRTIPESSKEPYDFFIGANLIYKDIYTDKTGGSAAAAVFTLGLVPSTYRQRITLDVGLSAQGKKLFDKTFKLVDEGNAGLWTYTDDLAQLNDRMHKRLIADFVRELEGSGVLDPQ